MRQNWIRLGLALGTLWASGCTTTIVTEFSDHDTNPTSVLQAMSVTTYLFAAKVQHAFYMCRDTGNALVCKRECGGPNVDLGCPEASGSGYHRASNVR